MNSPAGPSHEPGASVAGSGTPTGGVSAAAGPIGDLTTNAPRAGEAKDERPEIPEMPSIPDVYWKRDEVYTLAEKTEAWEKAGGLVQEYSDEMTKRWNEEINAYLTFAGLFSAVLTTFNVQTYSLLHPATPDPSVVALQQISAQLVSFSSNPPFLNSTHKPITQDTVPSTSDSVARWVVWLNGLWFSGLILSLAAATLGISVKQWTNEYTSGATGRSRPVARLRQHRLNNLKKWRVEDVVGAIPVLLQLALACFLAGMLILLWNLHDTVAAVASVLAGLLGLFTITTTLLPLYTSSCPYLTPQARGLHSVWQPRYLVYWMYARTAAWRQDTAGLVIGIPFRFLSAALRLGQHLHRSFKQLSRQVSAFAQHLASPPESWKEHKQTWQGRERSAIGDLRYDLDKQILLEAYSSTLHPDALSAASVCLMDFDRNFVLDYFRQLRRSAREHFGTMAVSPGGPLGSGNQQKLLWLYIVLCAEFNRSWGHPEPLLDDEQAALGVYLRCGDWPSSMNASDAEWAVATISALLESRGATNSLRTSILPDAYCIGREWVSILRNAMRRKEPLSGVCLACIFGAYCQVRHTESLLPDRQSDGAKAALTDYLRSINAFLWCTHEVLRVGFPSDSVETVRAYTQDVLTELTRMLRVFADDRAQNLRATVDADALWSIMWTLTYQTSDEVLRCIPDDLLPDVLRVTDALSKPYDYDFNLLGADMPDLASRLKKEVTRIKGEPAAETSPNTARFPTGPSGMEAVASTSAARSSREPALDEPPPRSATQDVTSPAGPSGMEGITSTSAEDSSQKSARGNLPAMSATSAVNGEERRDTPPSGREAASSAGFEVSPQLPSQHHGLATSGAPAPDVEDHQEAASLTSGAPVSTTCRGVSSIHSAQDDAAGTSTTPAHGGVHGICVPEPRGDVAPSTRSYASRNSSTKEHSPATRRSPPREGSQGRDVESSPREESVENP